MPRRRWRARGHRRLLTPALRDYLETGNDFAPNAVAAGRATKWGAFFDVRELGEEGLCELWREHGAEILEDWQRTHPGTKPWAFERFGDPLATATLARRK